MKISELRNFKEDRFQLESDMSPIVSSWLHGQSLRVYSEVRYRRRAIDLVGISNIDLESDSETVVDYALKGEIQKPVFTKAKTVAIEMKLTLNKKVIHQASCLRFATPYVYVAIPHIPTQRKLDSCLIRGLGVLLVNKEGVVVVAEPVKRVEVKRGWAYRINVCKLEEGGGDQGRGEAGGQACRKGEGRAIEASKRIKEYLLLNPEASWQQVFQNVKTHYRTLKGMIASMQYLRLRTEGRITRERRRAIRRLDLSNLDDNPLADLADSF